MEVDEPVKIHEVIRIKIQIIEPCMRRVQSMSNRKLLATAAYATVLMFAGARSALAETTITGTVGAASKYLLSEAPV
jgi:hypothetical protein